MNSPTPRMPVEPSVLNERPAIPGSIPVVEPMDRYATENQESAECSLVNPPNPVMLDGIWKKRLCPFLKSICKMFLAMYSVLFAPPQCDLICDRAVRAVGAYISGLYLEQVPHS